MMGLSPLVNRRIQVLFRERDRKTATQLLMEECSENLRFAGTITAAGIERIQASVLKTSGGKLDNLKAAIETAKIDWREALYFAGFHEDTKAHLEWLK